MSGLKVALRIARRDAVRNKGRSTLVIAMIGLPVLVITALASALQTMSITPREALPWDLGSAEAKILPAHDNSRDGVVQDFTLTRRGMAGPRSETSQGPAWTAEEIRESLPPGSEILPVTERHGIYRTDIGYARASLIGLDLANPLTDGMYDLLRGRAPQTSGEAVVSAGIAEEIGGIGQTLHATRGGDRVQVVGVVRDPRRLDKDLIITKPGALGQPQQATVRPPSTTRKSWLVDTPRPMSWQDVRDLNSVGLYAKSRAVISDPPPQSALPAEVRARPDYSIGPDPRASIVIALIGAMIILEVVLLAGPAFAVGVRRQRRQLALVAASGGSAGHIRAFVLGSGVVLGLGAAVVGVVLGLAASWLGLPVLEAVTGTGAGPWEVPPGQVAAVLVIAVGSGVLAALVPATQAARQDVVAALAGRRGQVRSRVGWPLAGLLVFLGGVVLTVLAYQQPIGVVGGAILAELGLVLASPWIVGAAGSLARFLPLPLRLATRDATRNRGRTAPAVAAVMAATAGVTALSIGGYSDFEERRQSYRPSAPMGAATVWIRSGPNMPGSDSGGRVATVSEVLAAELPGVPLIKKYRPDMRGGVSVPPPGCSAAKFKCGSGIAGPNAWNPRLRSIAIGNGDLLSYLLGRGAPEARAALAAGKAVVFDPSLLRDGKLALRFAEVTGSSPRPDVSARYVPAVVAEPEGRAFAGAVLSPDAARERLGVELVTAGLVVDPAAHQVSLEEERKINERLTKVAGYSSLDVERGFEGDFTIPLLLLAAAALVLVLGGSMIATGLAAADLRPDLATLAAVGAAPRTRRLLAAGQAAFVAFLGGLLGVLSGSVPGIAVTWSLTTANYPGPADTGPVLEIPWMLLTGMVIVVPLLAAVIAGLFTRSRLPVTRRIGQ